MTDAIVATAISAAATIAATIITVRATNKNTLATLDKKSELSDEKIHGEINVLKQEIKTLSERVEKHNSMVERTYKLEGAVSALQNDIKDIKGANR